METIIDFILEKRQIKMTKVDIISGFLGAGKTTFIKQMIDQVFAGQKLVLIENEFGEIGIDGGFLKDAGIEITEMNSGCICCTLVGDFSVALKKVLDEYHPDRVLIEPSGVGKLSDIVRAVEDVKTDAPIEIEGRITVVDGKKAKMYMKNFGEFYKDQVASASTIVISRTQEMSGDKIEECVALLREENKEAAIITTPRIAAIGRIKSPSWFFLSIPPHFPKNKHALGRIAPSKSMMIAALGLPIPKLIIVIPSAEAEIIFASLPKIGTLN